MNFPRAAHLPWVLLITLVSFASAGCVTQKETDALRRDVDQLKRQLSVQTAEQDSHRRQLKEVIEQATQLLTRNSADLGAQVERLEQRIAQLTGSVEENANAIGTVKQLLAEVQTQSATTRGSAPGVVQPDTPPVPQDKDELYALGVSKLGATDPTEGHRLLRLFVSRYPDDRRVPDIQLRLGNSYYGQQKFAPAIQELRKIVEKYPKSSLVPEALYKIGMSFYQLKFCSDASLFLSELVKRHRSNRHTDEARRVLKLIQRYRKNKRICTR